MMQEGSMSEPGPSVALLHGYPSIPKTLEVQTDALPAGLLAILCFRNLMRERRYQG